jgi:hypothetical protein
MLHYCEQLISNTAYGQWRGEYIQGMVIISVTNYRFVYLPEY